MWEWSGYLCAVLLLAYHSVMDLRDKHIPKRSLTAGVILSFGWAVVGVIWGVQSWPALGIGLVPGAFILLLARVTRDQIGRGDAWEVMYMGNLLGWANCLSALTIALFGIFLVSILLLGLGKARRNTRIPFVPFLCAGTIIRLLCL